MGAVQEELLSERGGFAEPELRLAEGGEGDYCAAEVLRVRHDPATDLLRVADARVLLDCCGRRSVRAERSGGPSGGAVNITLHDEPQPGVGRCEPGCAYDLAVGVLSAPTAPLTVRLIRDITDAPGGPTLIWQGEVDPAAGLRRTVLDETPAAPGCGAAGP